MLFFVQIEKEALRDYSRVYVLGQVSAHNRGKWRKNFKKIKTTTKSAIFAQNGSRIVFWTLPQLSLLKVSLWGIFCWRSWRKTDVSKAPF